MVEVPPRKTSALRLGPKPYSKVKENPWIMRANEASDKEIRYIRYTLDYALNVQKMEVKVSPRHRIKTWTAGIVFSIHLNFCFDSFDFFLNLFFLPFSFPFCSIFFSDSDSLIS